MAIKPISSIKRFLKTNSAGGVVLALAAIAALIVANSPLSGAYQDFLHATVKFQIENFKIEKDLRHWVNDGLMAIFFFLVGLELKREFVAGELSKISQVILPGIAAIGGVLIPATIYVAVTKSFGNPAYLDGWAIPAATDIAFAVGVLSLLIDRIPTALKIFLLTVAIFDDIGAIVIIALFYSGDLSYTALGFAGLGIIALALLNRLKVSGYTVYLIIGLLIWVAVLKSGVHATLAGVITALFIPFIDPKNPDFSPVKSLEHDLHNSVAFIILPLFAFVNAGISFEGMGVGDLFHPVPLGVMLGLVIGKPVGILLFSWLTIKFGWAALPKHVNWSHILGASLLCGIGFTMSLFIGGLAYPDAKLFDERIGIVLGSLISGLLGYFYLRHVTKNTAYIEE